MFNLSPVETFYAISAIVGGVLFLIRTILSLVGADADADVGPGIDISDFSLDHDLDGGALHDADAAASGASFRLFSMHGITGFFLMLGLIGLSLSKANMPVIISALGGAAAGGFTLVIVALIYYFMQKLQSDGTMKIQTAVGKTGSVYLTIPENGNGQVNIVVQGGLKQFDAISAHKERITTGERVRVIEIMNGKTLVVERIE